MGFFSNSDKRRSDNSLKTGIDMEEMDSLDLEDPFGGSDGVQDPGGRSPATATRKYVTEGVKGMAQGAMSVVGEEVERNMPNVAAVASELKDGYEDFQELKSEIQKQVQPMVISLENTTRKILPKVKRFMPDAWYNKAMGKLEERAAVRAGEAAGEDRSQQQADMISAELNAIFGQQAERDKQQDFEENKNRLIDRAVASTRHRDTQHALIRLYDSVRSTELFHRTLHTAYMKKSLELKYKQLFIQQDTHNLIARSFSAFETYFKAIAKNTALPDVMKTQASDYIKKSRTEKYGTMMSEYLSKARSMVFSKIKDSLKNALEGVGMGIDMAGQGADMVEMMDQMSEMGGENPLKMMIARGIGSLAGRAAAGGPVAAMFQRFAPWATAINGNFKNFKTRAYMGMNELRNRWSTGSWWQQMLADFLPSVSTGSTTGSNDLLTKSEEAAPFDKLTRQSIVEIIPGYLSNIWHSIEKMRTGNEDIEQRVYNVYERDFTSKTELQESIYNDPRMFGGKAGQSGAVGEALAVLKAGNTNKNPGTTEDRTVGIEDAVSRIITNHYLSDRRFNPVFLKQFINSSDDADLGQSVSEYIADISKGLSDEEFGRCARVIVDYLTGKDGEFDERLVKRFQDAIYTAMTQSDGFKTQAPAILENFGYRHILSKRHGGANWLIDKDNAINQDILGRRLSEFELKDARQTAEWDKRSTDEYLKASDYVGTRTKELKEAYRESAFGKWVNRTMKSGKQVVDATKDTVGGAASDLSIYITKTRIDAKLAKLVDPETPPDAISSLVAELSKHLESLKNSSPDEYKKYEEKIKSAIESLRKVDAEQASKFANAVQNIDNLVVQPKPATKAAPAGGDEAAKGESGEEPAAPKKTLWSKIKGAVTRGYDRFTSIQSEEDIDKIVDKTKRDLEELAAKRPKDFQEAKTMLREILEKEEKEHPEAARKLRDAISYVEGKYKQASNSKLAKTLSVIGSWSSKKATKLYDKYGKPITEKYTKLLADLLNEAIIAGNERVNGLVVMVARKYPDRLKKLNEECPALVDAYLKQAPAEVADVLNKILAGETVTPPESGEPKESIWERTKKALSEDLKAFKSKIRSTTSEPTEPTASVELGDTESVAAPSGELMDLLRAWKEEAATSSSTMIDWLAKLSEQLAAGIPTKGGGGTVIERRRYGIFGAAGHAIARGASAVTKATWGAAKKLGGIYAGTYKLGLAGLTSAVGGLSKVAGWATNQIGLTPYVDIYVKGQSSRKPIVTWRQQAFAPGIVYGKKEGDDWVPSEKRVEASRKIDRPCFDPRNGNMVITEDDIKNGLITSDGSVLGSIGKLLNTTASGFFKLANTGVKGFWNAVGIAAKGIFGWGGEQEKYVDIYRKDEIGGGYKPILTRLKQKRRPGVMFANKKRVERSSDIHEPVYDPVTGEELISPDDIEHGLVGVDNKPIGSGQSGFHDGLLQGGMKLGNTIARGLFGKTGLKIIGGAAMGLGAIYKGMWETIFGAGKAVTSGVSKLGARLFGFDTRDGFGSKAIGAITKRQDGTNTRLDKIASLVEAILQSMQAMSAGGGGPGGGGGKAPGSFKGRRGFWRNGKFQPDPKGDSWEFPKGIDPSEYISKVVAAAGAGTLGAGIGEEPDRTVGSEKAGRGKAARPAAAPDDNFSDDDEESPEGSGSSMGLLEWMMVAQFVPKRLRKFIARQLGKIKTLPRRILRHTFRAIRHPVKTGRAIKRLAKIKYHKAAKVVKSIPRAYKATKTALSTAKTAAKAAYAAKVAKNARTAARFAKTGKTLGRLTKMRKLGRFGALAAAGAAGLHALRGGSKAATATAEAAKGGAEAFKGVDFTIKSSKEAVEAGKKSEGLLSRMKGWFAKSAKPATAATAETAAKGAEAGAKAAEAGAEKGAGLLQRAKNLFGLGKTTKEAAAASTEAAARGAEAAAKAAETATATTAKTASEAAAATTKASAEAATKGAEAGAKAATETAGEVGSKAAKIGTAAKIAGLALDAFFAGDNANEYRHNAEEMTGIRNISDRQRDAVAQQGALNSLGSDLIGGVGALGGMIGIKSGDKLADAMDEFNKNAARAGAELENEVGGIHLGTDLASRADRWVGNMDEIPWYRLDKMAVKGGARIIDGATNVTSGLADGAWKILAGGAKAAWTGGKASWNMSQLQKEQDALNAKVRSMDEKIIAFAEQVYTGTVHATLDPYQKKRQLWNDFKEFRKLKHPALLKSRSPEAKAYDAEIERSGGVWVNTRLAKVEFAAWIKEKYGVKDEKPAGEAASRRRARRTRNTVAPTSIAEKAGDTNTSKDKLKRLFHLFKANKSGTLDDNMRKELATLGITDPANKEQWKEVTTRLRKESRSERTATTPKPTTDAKSVPEAAAPATSRLDRLEQLRKLHRSGKLSPQDKKELSDLGVDFPEDEDEWLQARKSIQLEEKATTPKPTTGVDKSQLIVHDVAKSPTRTTAEMREARRNEEKSSAAATTSAIAASSDKTAELLRTQSEKLDAYAAAVAKHMEMMNKNFGTVFTADGMRVAGMDTLTAVTAAKPAAGTTVINNNTINQVQDLGLDLRKVQQ